MKEVIGHGAVAEALRSTDKDVLFFASGVANSQETRESEYDRERELLLSQPRDRRLVYFSSLCTLYDPDTRYSKHKIEMEETIKREFPQYTIMRLGNVTWGKNTNQLVPFIKSKLKAGEDFPIYEEQRHLTDRDEFEYWIEQIPLDRNCEITITGRRMWVKDIVEELKQ